MIPIPFDEDQRAEMVGQLGQSIVKMARAMEVFHIGDEGYHNKCVEIRHIAGMIIRSYGPDRGLPNKGGVR